LEYISEDFDKKRLRATILERFWDVPLQERFFYRFLLIFEVARTRKNKQNHDTVIKNQGFAEVRQSRFGDRFFIDFGVDFRRLGHHFGAPDRFLREKTKSKTTSEIRGDFHGF